MTTIVQRKVCEARLVASRDEAVKLQTYAIRVCVHCGKSMGPPKTEEEYLDTSDCCSRDCWKAELMGARR